MCNQSIFFIYFIHVLRWNFLTIFLFYFPTELLATSRFSRMTQSFIDTEDSGIYQNMGDDNTSRMARDMNDFLGPLPNIPTTSTQESDKSWSRRMSGMSGIYEEIIDPCSR